MYLSRLILNMSLPETRRLLLSPYILHKAVFRAFPDVDKGGPGRILYRLDEDKGSDSEDPCLLVQSEKEPRWEKAELLTSCITSYESKSFAPQFFAGQVFYFRLRANPTVKKYMDDRPVRLGILRESEQLDWLKRKAELAGFAILGCKIINEGMTKDEKWTDTRRFKVSLLSVRFEGKLRITDPDLFGKILEQGIGSAKGMGFGLLSIAPVKE